MNSVCSSGDRTSSRHMHDKTYPLSEVSMTEVGESASRLSGKSLELLVPSFASVESSERALGVRSRPMREDMYSVCSSGDRTNSRRMHDRTRPPIEVSMLALGESAERVSREGLELSVHVEPSVSALVSKAS